MKKIILITGVSSGFGKESARVLAEAGHIVYGTVRKGDIQSEKYQILKMDLTDLQSIKTAVKRVAEKEGRIDVLINNAGMHTGGPIETLPVEFIKLQMDTNFIGTINIIKEVLPIMRSNGGGTIINLSSIGGLLGLPYQGIYSAAKFAIEGASEALRIETRKFNIKIVLINPSDFQTNSSVNRRNFLAPTGDDDPYKEQFEKTLALIEKDEANGLEPAVLARKIVKIVESKNPRQRYLLATFLPKLAVALKHVLPAKIFSRLLGIFYGIS